MDIQEDFLNMQIAYEKNCAVRCNCSYEELKAQLDKSESLFGTRYLEGSPRHENWLLWVQAWQAAKAQAVPEWIEYEKQSPRIDGRYQIFINGEQLAADWESPYGFSSAEDGTAFIQELITHWSVLNNDPAIKAQEPAND